MKPVLLYEQVGNQVIETDDLPRIVDPKMIIDRMNTILDPGIMENGTWVNLGQVVMDYANREISDIWIPPIHPMEDQGMWVMHPVMWVANQIARIMKQIEEGTTRSYVLQKMVHHYQGISERELIGKTGLLRQAIIGSRMLNSGRAVLVPNGSYEPEEVGIPGRFFEKMEIDHHDLILIGRNPAIWTGSVEIVKARRSSDNVVELHPLLFQQLGGDCDGDDIWFVPIPKDPLCQEEAEVNLLEFCLTHATWSKQANYSNAMSNTPNWANIKEDTKERFRITGFSVSPDDIVKGGESVETVERVTGKTLAKSCCEIAQGLSEKKVWKVIDEKNFETLRMKKHLGLVGIACNRLKILSTCSHHWIDSANYMSERLQQILLDAKHLDGSYSVFDVLKILNKSGQWKGARIRDALNELSAIGSLDVERCKPIMLAIYFAYPLMIALEDILPTDVNRRPLHATLRKVGGSIDTKLVVRHLEHQITDLGFGDTLPIFREKGREYSLGLTSMANHFHPLHEAIATRQPKRALTRRIFQHNDIDQNGPCRQAWDVWHEIMEKQV